MIGPLYRCEEDGYVLDFYHGLIEPVPTYRIDGQGNRIPLSAEEIIQWQENYRKDHPEVEKCYQEREVEQKRLKEVHTTFLAEMEKRATWWNKHSVLKSLCKPFLSERFKYYGIK
jgi:hypothetical protein